MLWFWSSWKEQGDSQKNSGDSRSSGISAVSSQSVSTPSTAGSALLYNAETTPDGLQTPSVSVLPTVPRVAPVGLTQGMFQQASNTSIGTAVFNIYGPSPPPSSDGTTTSAANPHSRSSRVSGAGLDLPMNPIPAPQSSLEIYVHHLMTKDKGYPLWIPSPNRRLPATYRVSGVGFGDVGILMPEGGFSFLFNVVHDATHPINASRRLPEGFAPFTAWNPDDIEEYEEFSAGSYLADKSRVRVYSDDDRSSAFDPPIAPFREYIRANLKSWYRFVMVNLGREINNGELRVVYGCRKSAGFGIATVLNSGSADASTELTFTTNEVTGCKYRWHYKGFAEAKAGPSLVEHRDILPQGNRDHDPIVNQCLFVSTIDMPLSAAEWNSINPVATSLQRARSQSTSSPSSFSTSTSGGATSDSGNSNVSPQGQGANTSRSQDTSTPVPHDEIALWPPLSPSKRLFHPSDIIADFLLRVFPHATSVSLCSDNWGPGMTDSVGTVATLISNVLSFNDICEDHGMVYLKRNDSGMIINHLELVSPSAIQWLWTEWRNQHNLSLIWLELDGEPSRVLAPSFPVFVKTRLAKWNVILSPWMLSRIFPVNVRPSHISTRILELVQEDTDGLFVGRFTLAALSGMRFFVAFWRAPDGSYTLHGDTLDGSASSTLTRAELTTNIPSPHKDTAAADFRLFYPHTPNDVEPRKNTASSQFNTLESIFKTDSKPNAALRQKLVDQLEMTPRGAQFWFQNRPAREKTKPLKQKGMAASRLGSPDESSWRFSFSLNSSELLGLDAPDRLNMTLMLSPGNNTTQIEEVPFHESVEWQRSIDTQDIEATTGLEASTPYTDEMSGHSVEKYSMAPHLLAKPPQHNTAVQDIITETSHKHQENLQGGFETYPHRKSKSIDIESVDRGAIGTSTAAKTGLPAQKRQGVPLRRTEPLSGTQVRVPSVSSSSGPCTWDAVAKGASRQDVVIFVVGLTGAGKSTFIRGVAPLDCHPAIVPSDGLESETKDYVPVIISDYTRLSAGSVKKLKGGRLIVVDTPGYDDTFVLPRDSQIGLGKCLKAMRGQKMDLGGIIYLYDTTQNRMKPERFADHIKPYEDLLPTQHGSIVLGLTGFTATDDQFRRRRHLEIEHWKPYARAVGFPCVMTFPKVPDEEHWKAFDHIIKSFEVTDRGKAYDKKISSLLHPKKMASSSGKPKLFTRLFNFL
ncbi:hypothetical protein D9619_004182 [Psilocybe cf. subviscida]|uniref:Homeobox domain-containing protein n=1 Tax=Psilocybe cf. subviscida TaxID=2480587 RepID=A0A8H5BNT8_9AGAR|nr:hypothetical protein D9619_004182 [Psilocybe cf. subviscida]